MRETRDESEDVQMEPTTCVITDLSTQTTTMISANAITQTGLNDEPLHLLNDVGTSMEHPSTCEPAIQTNDSTPTIHHVIADNVSTASINDNNVITNHHQHCVPCFENTTNTSKMTVLTARPTHSTQAEPQTPPVEP